MMLAVAGTSFFVVDSFAAGEFALMKVRESQLHAGKVFRPEPGKNWPGRGRLPSILIFIWPPARQALRFLPWR
ncbi:MAG: hypothetical protein ACLSUW_04530 [Akkermansia sp.]